LLANRWEPVFIKESHAELHSKVSPGPMKYLQRIATPQVKGKKKVTSSFNQPSF
jgi:hypothetical protein